MEMRWDLSLANEKTTPGYVAEMLNGRLAKFKKLVVVHVYGAGGLALDSKIQDMTFDAFRARLQGLVDQWIDSGRRGQEAAGDEPLTRSVTWVSPKYLKQIRETLHHFWQLHSLSVTIDSDSGLPIARLDVRRETKTRGDAASAASWYGVAWFQRLLDSASPHCLSRCDACQSYFVRSRSPKKDTPIFRGTFCAACKTKGGAKRNYRSRKALREDMFDFAAAIWFRWKRSHDHPDQYLWVANKVTDNFAKRLKDRRLGHRWVAQKANLRAIMERVERRNNAKG